MCIFDMPAVQGEAVFYTADRRSCNKQRIGGRFLWHHVGSEQQAS
jgi:hypothetical protein